MTGGRFPMDLATGMTDLCWNLVMFFFVCTVVLARPALSALPDAALDGTEGGHAAVIRFAEVGAAAWASAVLSTPGDLEPPGDGERLDAWLGRTCAGAAAILVCPEEASHRECRSLAAQAAADAPNCRVQY